MTTAIHPPRSTFVAGTAGAPSIAPVAADSADAAAPDTSLGACLKVGMSATIAAVFVLSTVLMHLYRGDLVESAGLGAFFAFWLGSGFGVLVSGVWWDSRLRAAGEH